MEIYDHMPVLLYGDMSEFGTIDLVDLARSII